MKIIDLLNKIANGEQPKAFEYNEELYIWEDKDKWYLSEPLLNLFYIHDNILNDEIEIIEDTPKKIEKLDIRQEKNIKNNWKWKIYIENNNYNISTPQKIIADRLNKVIDYINKMEK